MGRKQNGSQRTRFRHEKPDMRVSFLASPHKKSSPEESDIDIEKLCSVQLITLTMSCALYEVLKAEWPQPLTDFLGHLYYFQVIESLHIFYR